MGNKGKRNLALAMLILQVGLYIAIIVRKVFLDIAAPWYYYVSLSVAFVLFLGFYRNFSQGVKEDEKYGPIIKKD